jgi:hypothetical protein
LNHLHPYQITSLLLKAERETGILFSLDDDLEAEEFVLEPLVASYFTDVEVSGVRLSCHTPFETTVVVVTMLGISESWWLDFLTNIPGVGKLTWMYQCNKTANRYMGDLRF